MEPTFVDVRYSRVFPHALAPTFAWLTDYQDDDPGRTTAIVKARPVLHREPGKVTMEGELEIFGSRGKGKVEVDFHPPSRYVARIVEGQGRGCVFEYELTPVDGGTRLDVVYHIRVKRWKSRIRVTLGKPLFKRELRTMWDGFAASMDRDMAAAAAVPA